MESSKFKNIFGEIANNNGFERAYEGWFKEFPEVIQVLDLQKSNHGDLYYINIKIFIQGAFGKNYVKNKSLVKNEGGHIFLRQPDMYSDLLNLEKPLDETERRVGINKMFEHFLTPFSEKTSSKDGIKELHRKGDLFILPAVKEELGGCNQT